MPNWNSCTSPVTTPIATLITSRVPKNRVSRRYSGFFLKYQAVCRSAVRTASPIVTGTKKKWLTVTNPNSHRARSSRKWSPRCSPAGGSGSISPPTGWAVSPAAGDVAGRVGCDGDWGITSASDESSRGRRMSTQTPAKRYPDISEHGLIGDLQTAALVSTDGTVDFFCCPRFDSPSVFCSLLDADKGGYFRVSPVAGNYVTKQLYFPNTAMLITRFMTPDGVGEVLDFMPVIEGGPTDRHRLVRHLRVARGTMKFVLEIQPRFDYGRVGHTIEATEVGAVFRAENGMHLTVHTAGKRRDAADGGV